VSSKTRPEPLAPAPRSHPEQGFALSALGWRVAGVRPVVGAGGSARYSVTIARRDGAVSMAITHADPAK